ncbi:P-loop NTPase fold protein [Nocardioides sp. YIM 152588]|uniref:P-loop NTPase fold protein n=1 Tax=Nocardioides sp. YIM 152588 TaxID=3158259 RepID=UPI0032E41490
MLAATPGRKMQKNAAIVAVTLVAVGAAVALWLLAPGSTAAAVTTVTAVGGVVGSVLSGAAAVSKQVDAGVDGAAWALGTRVLGGPEARLLREHDLALAAQGRQVSDATAAAFQADAALQEAQDRASVDPLGVLLEDIDAAGDYRDHLTLVSKVQEHFTLVNRAVRDHTGDPQHTPAQPLDRVVVLIDDLDRCPPKKVAQVLETVHLLFDFEMFAVVLAVDTRWLEQSLQIRYRKLLGGDGATASPTDYLEKIVQIPIQLFALAETDAARLVRGLTASAPPTAGTGETTAAPDGGRDAAPDGADRMLLPVAPRPEATTVRATALEVSDREAAALSAAASLAGSTPRAVKRFVNTYRLVKATADAPEALDQPRHGELGDHDAIAVLLAMGVGLGTRTPEIHAALRLAPPGTSLEHALGTVATGAPRLARWLADHPTYARAPVDLFRPWLRQTSRYSFHAPPSG